MLSDKEISFLMEIKKITSRNNEYIKELAKLGDRKKRSESGKFAFEGKKLLSEAISFGAPIEAVLMTEKAISDFKGDLSALSVIEVSNEVYEKISFEKSPEGIFCVSKVLDKLHNLYIIYKGSFFGERIFLLDGIRDPGNLGTMLRTAFAFGCDTVVMSADCADVYNSKTVRASMGAVFKQKTVRVSDMAGTVSALKDNGYTVLCAALDDSAVSLTDVKIDEKTCFVVGNEGAGIRKEIIDASNGTVIIPMENGTESLNAASAATVLMWEQYRQRK